MTTTLSTEVRSAITEAMRTNTEIVIKDMAGTVCSLVRSRRDHPSYGTTKGQIRDALQRMEGAIGLYMVQHGQASHTSLTVLAEFVWPETTALVNRARQDVRDL